MRVVSRLEEGATPGEKIGVARRAQDGKRSERRRLLELIIQKLTLRRVLTVLLKNDRPLCERCLAHYARMALGQATTMLDHLRQVIAVSVQLGECLACREFTRTFFLAKTHSEPTQDTAS